jgi:hypothetical protein
MVTCQPAGWCAFGYAVFVIPAQAGIYFSYVLKVN